MAEAKRDENRVPTLLGVSSVDGVTPVVLYANPTTHRLLVEGTGGGSANATQSVYHGSDATVARPTGAYQVIWVGTVEPNNWLVGDIWIDNDLTA
jgi:hypothetical protein